MASQSPSPLQLALLLFIPLALHHHVAHSHNITKILSQFPEFSTLNSLLSQTHLAADINSRQVITVLAPSDAALSPFSSKHTQTLRDLLSVHAVLDYYDASKLHHLSGSSAVLATLFQASGRAVGQAGFINVTNMGGSRVAFRSADAAGIGGIVDYVKVLATQPYNISVVEVSGVIVPPGVQLSGGAAVPPFAQTPSSWAPVAGGPIPAPLAPSPKAVDAGVPPVSVMVPPTNDGVFPAPVGPVDGRSATAGRGGMGMSLAACGGALLGTWLFSLG